MEKSGLFKDGTPRLGHYYVRQIAQRLAGSDGLKAK